MSFAVSADAYDRFMGRYSVRLAPVFADFADVAAGQQVLDVGCGPGALTGELVARVGPSFVTAVDPSSTFVEALRARHSDVSVHEAPAEQLPFDDHSFDRALAQLVVHFMTDPVGGLGEMRRVMRAGGLIAACVWDHAGGRGPLNVFWEAVRATDPGNQGEATLPGARQGHLGELLTQVGLDQVEETALSIRVEHPTFDDWWEPFTLGVGPAGAYVAGLGSAGRAGLRDQCRALLPAPPFEMVAVAWAGRGTVRS